MSTEKPPDSKVIFCEALVFLAQTVRDGCVPQDHRDTVRNVETPAYPEKVYQTGVVCVGPCIDSFDRMTKISTCLEVVIPQASRRSIISCQTVTEIRSRGQYKAEVAGRGGRRGRCEGRWVSVRKNAVEVMGQAKGYVLLKTLEFNRHVDVFSAAVLPNPVISACELCTSDISD